MSEEKWHHVFVPIPEGKPTIYIGGKTLEQIKQDKENAQKFLPDLLDVIDRHNLDAERIRDLLKRMISSGDKASRILEAQG